MSAKNKIESVKARQILDSRGKPSLEVEITSGKKVFRAGVPSGTSCGKYEAVYLAVKKAIRSVHATIAPALKGKDPRNQKEIDALLCKLDGTKNKSRLGANATTGISMAVCRAGAAAKKIPLYSYILELSRGPTPVKVAGVRPLEILPRPCFNVINGGAHAENDLDIQEFMIVPQMDNFFENLRLGQEIYQQLKEDLKKKYDRRAINLGLEGGFAPKMKSSKEALDAIMESAGTLGHDKNIKIILDVASSEFFQNGKYRMRTGVFSAKELMNFYSDLTVRYPILGLEDPFAEDDWESWRIANRKWRMAHGELLLIGDDLLTTNTARIKEAYEKKACNAAIIKINQIGTVSEAIKAAKLAKSYGWKIIVSHRSGDTKDDFIADFAVGVRADFIKSGAPATQARLAKYRRLLKIEAEMIY